MAGETEFLAPTSLGGDGVLYRAVDMLNFGYLTRFFPILNNVLALAESSAASALASAAGAANLVGTSTTSLAVGTGSKSFTATSAKSWVAGMWLVAFRTSVTTTYMLGRVVSYNSGTGALVLDVTGTNGSGTYTDWTIAPSGPQGATGSVAAVGEASLTSNYTVGTGDRGKVLRLSGTFTLSLMAAATMTAGFWAYWHNEGTGDVTVDPAGSEQIDGVTSFVIYPGEARLFWVTAGAAAWESIVLAPFCKRWTSGVNTFTKPPGYYQLRRRGRGGGGSGGKSGSGSYGVGGGGGGAGFDEITPASDYGATTTITIGAGGPAVTTAGPGVNGGDTIIGALRTAYGGGAGGGNGSASHYGGTGGGLGSAGTAGGATSPAGGAGLAGSEFSKGHDVSNPNRPFGGGVGGSNFGNASGGWFGGPGGGGRSTAGTDRAPGASLDAVGGTSGDSTSGAAGTGYGAGGGGTRTGASSGAGTGGFCEISGVC